MSQPVRVALHTCCTLPLQWFWPAAHTAVVQPAPEPLVTQMGVSAGQLELPLNAPFAHARRLPLSAHCETEGPQALPSALQVRRAVLPTHSVAFGRQVTH